MALVAATLQANFTSIYAGPHRVCFRIVGAPTYTCTTDLTHPNCAGGGAACSYDIPITIDDETCTQVDYEGYVQPACEDEVSLVGRVPFLVSFIPDPACNRYQVTCVDSLVASPIIIDNPGSGYDYTTPPAVVFSGGAGAGATGTAVIGDGDITALAITVTGSGYTDGVYPGTALIGGTGTGATADITIVGGVVTLANIVAPGNDYVTGDILAPDTGVVGVPGVPAQLTATSDLGTLLSVTLDTPGSGYTSAPNVTIDPPGAGTTALASSTLVGCTQLTIQDCNGVTIETIAAGYFQPSEVTFMCGSSEPTVPADFSVAEVANCLCECTEYDIENVGAGPDTIAVTWIDCNDVVQTAVLASGAGPTNICAVTDSITFTLGGATATMSTSVVGPCPAAP